MEDQLLGEDALLWQLRDSRRRFQRHMQRLIEKYNQPFEDAPLVQMSTLTYETPQGLRFWGGGLVKERNKGRHIQDSPVETASRSGGDPAEASARGPASPVPGPRVLAVDSESNDDASLYQEDVITRSFMPAVPWSPLKNELRRKYLTQVDVLLQDEGYSECTDDGGGEDTRVTLSPSWASPAGPAHGSHDRVSERGPGGPVKPTSWPGEGDPADLALVPRSDGLSFRGTGGHSRSSSPALEADIICDVTISDLYAGMLHSMSRLLSTKPACIISTKTSFVAHSWSARRRHKCKNRTHRTLCRGGGPSRRASQETLAPFSEPLKDGEALRDCENFLDASGRRAGVKSGKAFPEVNKPEICQLDPSWKELQGLKSLVPQGCSSLTYGGTSAVHHLGQENRLRALKWLISPVKIVSRPRILPRKGGNHYREIGIKFDKLHQEYCPNPGKQPCLISLPGPSAVAVYRGPPSSHGPRGSESRRLGGFHEALEDLAEGAIGAARYLPARGPPPSLPETTSVQSPGRSEQTLDLLFQGNHLEILRKSLSPSKATSVAGVKPLSCGRRRYNEIKEKFDRLHQKYCQQSPPWTQAALRVGTSPGASMEVQYPKGGTLEKLNAGSGFQGPSEQSASPRWSTESPLGSTTLEAQPSMSFPLTATRSHQSPPKRRRLSDSLLYGQWPGSQDPARVVGHAIPWPGERPAPDSPPGKRRKEHTFQDGRGK